MKIVKTFRIDKEFSQKVTALAESQGITFSQFVELACYALADEQPKLTKKIEKSKKLEVIDLQMYVDQSAYRKLIKIIQAKNSTLSQELNYRLSATLENPVFNDVELGKLWAVKVDIDRLGNLFKLAIDQKTPVNDELFKQLNNNVTELRNEFNNILNTVNQRTLMK
ncbi:hypothetical protein [Aggregatibacter actinomycetemcomitans]|uniref:hypothetical protein n=1 Tax=Aggregatibacter actinomycetemcomitans TaxID=714 RepID=UPI0006A73413|nr:hypothetical protein [Aggregatibacter actinomycetemcomitans]KOE62560.1 hypothetical protein D17P2_0303110 [Aggregatibacter actinomycetemcomitans serotype c str. D17P-2]